jgi:hypothetical protein
LLSSIDRETTEGRRKEENNLSRHKKV